MLTKSALTLLLAFVGFVQAAPLRYAYTDQPTDLDSNPGVRPISPQGGGMHILPYYPANELPTAAKRQPLKLVPFDPQANPGVRPLTPHIPVLE